MWGETPTKAGEDAGTTITPRYRLSSGQLRREGDAQTCG